VTKACPKPQPQKCDKVLAKSTKRLDSLHFLFLFLFLLVAFFPFALAFLQLQLPVACCLLSAASCLPVLIVIRKRWRVGPTGKAAACSSFDLFNGGPHCGGCVFVFLAPVHAIIRVIESAVLLALWAPNWPTSSSDTTHGRPGMVVQMGQAKEERVPSCD